ncbi:MAG: DUF2076 domain-containing protein [Pikeienuella sp.]|uniref:DUF2076 domain-containing protein n=1 Tax=Pikeienuella sp. TaxID=2831957 RepID=UPI00391A41A0
MDHNDRAAIENLFARLRQVEESAPPRDPEAEAMIEGGLARQRGAAYRMAQTIVAQERALEEAARRIEALEARGSGGSFLGDLFGGSDPAPRPRPAAPPPQAAQRGGFLAGAAQTALGVAGGFLVADMISGAFGGVAEASDWGGAEDGGDGGGDFDFDL